MNDRLTIGEFSRFCQVTVKTLRHYERMRLLVPSEVDEWTHYRYYNVSQMQQLNSILRLKEMGFSLDEVRELQDEGTQSPTVEQLERKMKQVEEAMDTLHERLQLLRRITDTQTRMEEMTRISIQRMPEIIVASHRVVLKRREDLPSVCANVVGPEIQRLGCKRSLPINWFVVEHEEEYKTENIDVEIFEQVENLLPDTPILHFRIMPEIPTAVCMKNYGPTDNLREHLAELMEYVNEHGYKPCGPYYTRHVDYVWNQKDPEKWLSIIYLPVTRDKRPRILKRLVFAGNREDRPHTLS